MVNLPGNNPGFYKYSHLVDKNTSKNPFRIILKGNWGDILISNYAPHTGTHKPGNLHKEVQATPVLTVVHMCHIPQTVTYGFALKKTKNN